MSGRNKTIPDAAILREFMLASKPILTSSEVQERCGFGSRQGAYERLQDLVDDGSLESEKVGANARVFWITDVGENRVEMSRE